MMTFDEWRASIEGFETLFSEDITSDRFFGFPMEPILAAETFLRRCPHNIAYFSMEYGLAPSIYNTYQQKRVLDPKNQFFEHEVFSNYWLVDYIFSIEIDKLLDIPIYGGGLGVLAGDTIKSAADSRFPFIGVGILWNKGYFKQHFWFKTGQIPEELAWDPWSYPGLIPLKTRVSIETVQGPLVLRLWKYYVFNKRRDWACPLLLLDANLEENDESRRRLTDQLYRSDDIMLKIAQRCILGLGGVKALRAQNYPILKYHLNEGHAAFALVELMREQHLMDPTPLKDQLQQHCVFTCHTPVAAGHDRFAIRDLRTVLPEEDVARTVALGQDPERADLINLTHMSLKNCGAVNAVSAKHGEVMRWQFPDYKDKIDAITNGVHLHTWMSERIASVLDQFEEHLGDWREDPSRLNRLDTLRSNFHFRRALVEAHQKNKQELLAIVRPWRLDETALTLAWARRIAAYKRPSLIFHRLDRLIDIAYNIGPIQIFLAGKAHPNDDLGQAHIDELMDRIDELNAHRRVIKVLFLENYDTYFGHRLSSSVDVWLNNPLPPFEASGTSGMKAVLNGVLQLSTVDGWMVEAMDRDIGWTFGHRHEGGPLGSESELHLDEDAVALCDTLSDVAQTYYGSYWKDRSKKEISVDSIWVDKMINALKAGAFFNTQRMVDEYRQRMWRLEFEPIAV